MTADMATIDYFLCMPKILSNCYVRFPHTKSDDVFLFDAHVKLISGTYILQKNKARFNQYEVSSLCPLCGIEPEDLMHFMLTCEKLEEA